MPLVSVRVCTSRVTAALKPGRHLVQSTETPNIPAAKNVATPVIQGGVLFTVLVTAIVVRTGLLRLVTHFAAVQAASLSAKHVVVGVTVRRIVQIVRRQIVIMMQDVPKQQVTAVADIVRNGDVGRSLKVIRVIVLTLPEILFCPILFMRLFNNIPCKYIAMMY